MRNGSERGPFRQSSGRGAGPLPASASPRRTRPAIEPHHQGDVERGEHRDRRPPSRSRAPCSPRPVRAPIHHGDRPGEPHERPRQPQRVGVPQPRQQQAEQRSRSISGPAGRWAAASCRPTLTALTASPGRARPTGPENSPARLREGRPRRRIDGSRWVSSRPPRPGARRRSARPRRRSCAARPPPAARCPERRLAHQHVAPGRQLGQRVAVGAVRAEARWPRRRARSAPRWSGGGAAPRGGASPGRRPGPPRRRPARTPRPGERGVEPARAREGDEPLAQAGRADHAQPRRPGARAPDHVDLEAHQVDAVVGVEVRDDQCGERPRARSSCRRRVRTPEPMSTITAAIRRRAPGIRSGPRRAPGTRCRPRWGGGSGGARATFLRSGPGIGGPCYTAPHGSPGPPRPRGRRSSQSSSRWRRGVRRRGRRRRGPRPRA